MLSVKIKRIPTIFKKFSWKLNFHDMEILPFMIVLFDTIIITTALSALGMQTISYLTLAVVLVIFLLLFTLNFRHKVLSRYGLLYLLFFLVLLGTTVLYGQDIKNCIYMSIYLGIILLVFRYYRSNVNKVYCYFAIALSLCVYANFVHLLTHPMLWVLEGKKDAAGYLLGNNYNQMGCRMMIALATSVLCTKFSKIWIINSIAIGITCIITLVLVNSMTSLSMIVIFLVYCIIPSSKLRKAGIYSLLTVLVLFQVFVVFNGNGLENNEFAVYIVNDILHKDITFTHRTDMWDSAMRVIIESPIWGWGFVKQEWFTSHMSSFAYGPHNFILSLFIFGGVLLFAAFIMIVYHTIMAIKAYMNERIGQYVIFSAVCLYFMGLMEMYPFTIMFYILIVMYYYQYTDKKNIENHH